MSDLKRRLNLSIFGRTFLLMLAALMIAEGIGIVLIIRHPPIHNRPISFSELAQRLGGDAEPHMQPAFGPSARGPGFDGPGQPPLDRGMDFRDMPERGLRIYEAKKPPSAPADLDPVASDMARQRLADEMGIDMRALVLYDPRKDIFFDMLPHGFPDELREGFIAARRLPDGSWRIVESVGQSFPNAFQKQALLLFGLGLLLLLPMSWLFSRALSVPIVSFSQAAKRVGADPNAPPLPVEGPSEMLAAIESFNAMQERLNSLLRERTEMIAAIAHDLRTPLTRLAFRLDDLPSPLNEKVSADIQEMKSMISLALDFIRDRSQTMRRERLDFRLLVESVVDDESDLGRDVTLAGGPSMTLEGDPLALRRAIMNIVDNAVKYGEHARLHLRAERDCCVLDIDDDGPGISEALHKRVFEPFYRVESSRNRDTGGVGLGLAVVRAIIQEHGGEILLRNRSPKGLRVTIRLPLLNR